MIGNFFKISLRILMRQKGYTLLNLLGLVLGITVFIFIYLYLQSELSYDRCWKNYRHIYRITEEYPVQQKNEKLALTPYLLADVLQKHFPEVKYSTRYFFTDPSDKNAVNTLKYKGNIFEVPDITLGDSRIFRIFNFPFTEGNPDSALTKPLSIVISKKTANEIFGDQPALGKKLKTGIREYTVTGVFMRKPCLTHLDFDGVVSANSIDSSGLKQLNSNWFWANSYTYVVLDDTADSRSFIDKVNRYTDSLLTDYMQREKLKLQGYYRLDIEPVTAIHFSTDKLYDHMTNVNRSLIYVFGLIAFFILFTASINYINISSARSVKRAREIGIRKVMGAWRKQLIWQYLSESFILTFLSFIIALSLAELLLPHFNRLIGKNLVLVESLFSPGNLLFLAGLIVLMLLLSVLSGLLPAFVVSSFQPVNVLRGNTFFLSRNQKRQYLAGNFRKWLVTIQYIVAVSMIVSTTIVWSQLHFIQNINPGFNKNNLLVVNTPPDTTFGKRAQAFTEALRNDSSIEMVTNTLNLPGYTSEKLLFTIGDTSQHKNVTFNVFVVGENFFQILDIPLIRGSFFTTGSDDSIGQVIVNKAAADYLGGNVLGTKISSVVSGMGKVAGVAENFNYSSLHSRIEPLLFLYGPKFNKYILVRYKPEMETEALKHVQNVWKRFNKGYKIHYGFLDEKMDSLYVNDRKMLSLFVWFSLFTLIISGLGLYGLTSLLMEQRTREIGIRKVLGGSISSITLLILRDYLKYVLIAGITATPVVYIAMHRWLNGFAYHIHLSFWFFVAGILLVMLPAALVVFARSLIIIRKNPSEALKYE